MRTYRVHIKAPSTVAAYEYITRNLPPRWAEPVTYTLVSQSEFDVTVDVATERELVGELNEWFCDVTTELNDSQIGFGYPNGTLLLWSQLNEEDRSPRLPYAGELGREELNGEPVRCSDCGLVLHPQPSVRTRWVLCRGCGANDHVTGHDAAGRCLTDACPDERH